ncbi:RIO kinase 2 [Cryptococcus neoformans]|nr:RIO kinase 2 [Cryptococcus neoformans var. grubii Bt1]OXG15102.1 RIO kinase 2 [Cryptococcus neoformans var. grubii Ze90-1]OXH24345.1 RIO kinase 2 [Cryptococcus neoformans var. grubii]
MKLDATDLRYISADEFRVLTAVEMGSKNHEVVPSQLVAELAQIRGGNVKKALGDLAKRNLVARVQNVKYDGFRLTYGGLDYLALRTFSRRKPPSVHSVGTRIGVGKESDIYVVADERGEKRVLKMHRLGRISFRAIKSKRDYLGKRKSASWMYMSRLSAQKEFAFMKALYQHGFPVPVPIDQARHCVVMSLVDGYPLRSVEAVDDPADLYSKLMELIVRLAHAGLIHGDFNEFNVMLLRKTGEPVVIDFPQMVSTRHENAEYFFSRDVNCIRRFFRRRFRYEATSWPTWKNVLEIETGNAENAVQGGVNDGQTDLPVAQNRVRIDLEVEASGFGRALQRELEDYMIEVQDIPGSESDEEEDEEDGEEKEEEEEEEALSSHVQGNDKKELSDEAAVAARLEALRLHRALGNDVSDEDADPDSEHSLTDFTSDDDSDDSDDSTGVAQTDFTTYTPSMRNQPRHHTRLPVKEFENRGGARSAIAKQVERERHQTERKVNAGKTSVKLGKQKGHKWKSSDKYVVGKDSGW